MKTWRWNLWMVHKYSTCMSIDKQALNFKRTRLQPKTTWIPLNWHLSETMWREWQCLSRCVDKLHRNTHRWSVAYERDGIALGGDSRPGLCVGKEEVSQAAGSLAPAFPCWKGTRTWILQLASGFGGGADNCCHFRYLQYNRYSQVTVDFFYLSDCLFYQ